MLDAASFNKQQDNQSIRRVLVPGARGRILDRNGEMLACNRPSRCIECYINELGVRGGFSNTVAAVEAALESLAAVVRVPRQVSRRDVERHVRQQLAMPLVVYRDIDEAAFARFAERFREFPAFSEQTRPERVYPTGKLAAHVIGSVKWDRPAAGDTADPDAAAPHFFLKEIRGRFGLEAYYDDYLVGVSGERLIQVDARGYRHGEWNGRRAKAGPDLVTTLDIGIQRELERQLDGVVGAAVVLDPRDGAVLALASSPSFDINRFVPGISPEEYRRLNDDPGKPLLDRAIAEYYAPGSTFKPITALAALASGIDPTAEYDCTGIYSLGEWRLRCSRRWGHGGIAMRRALEMSCNTYFCDIAHRIGTEPIVAAARSFGLGARTGVDLGGEKPGTVPDAEWKRAKKGEEWFPGDTCQMAIGQGMLQVTPLQMAVVAAALANGGDVYRPYLKAIAPGEPKPKPARTLPMRRSYVEMVRMGMLDVAERGTGKRIAEREDADGRVFRLAVRAGGKTGTAEVGSANNRRKNTWIIAFAPFEEPTIAVAMIVENGESGGLTVAPRVHALLASVFGETAAGDGLGEGEEAYD